MPIPPGKSLPRFLFPYLLGLLSACTLDAADSTPLERPLCWGWLEASLFDAWRDVAHRYGRPDKDAEDVVFQDNSLVVGDGTELYGYRAFTRTAKPHSQPAILIAPGNAMLADQLYRFAAYFASRGMTAYIFDYRGYGGSGGAPHSNAIIHDYREILSVVAEEGHAKVYVYAMSFGGIVVLAALTEAEQPAALVLDGVPSELPWYAFCPDRLDPVVSIEHAPARTLVISGTDDTVIPPDDMADLIKKARGRGMQTVLLQGFSHPGRDEPQKTARRLEVVKEFLNSRP